MSRPQIPLSSPDVTDKEIKSVLGVLSTSNLSLGPKLVEFENVIADYVGLKYAVAVNSGTSALHLLVKAMDIRDGDEVITTPFSFVASANCILFEKANPVFVDIDPLTLNINPDLIEEKITNKTKAILAVDVFGHPAQWTRLESIALKHNLRLIEDSCEAIGAEYKGKKAGSFGDAGTFAFYPNKQITTGEGGCIITDDKKIAALARSMRNQGRDGNDGWLQHKRLGYNYRISDINCALGIVQMERIEEILAKRENVAAMYNERLTNIDGLVIPYRSPEVTISWFVYVVRLADNFTRNERDEIIQSLGRKGIQSNSYFPPIHLQPFYVDQFGYGVGDFPVTEVISERTIALPFFNNLTERQIDYVTDVFKEEICKRVSLKA